MRRRLLDFVIIVAYDHWARAVSLANLAGLQWAKSNPHAAREWAEICSANDRSRYISGLCIATGGDRASTQLVIDDVVDKHRELKKYEQNLRTHSGPIGHIL